MSRKHTHEQVARLFGKALAGGATRLSLTQCEWDVSGRCQSPVTRETVGRPSVPLTRIDISDSGRNVVEFDSGMELVGTDAWGETHFVPRRNPRVALPKRLTVRPGRVGEKVTLSVIIHAKCRKCERCLRDRAAHWRLRSMYEARIASRNWFGTLTLSPGSHELMANRARHEVRQRGATDFESLPTDEQFLLRCAQVGTEVTKYLKRVRKASSARFRYLIVAEAHKTGLPHLHVLLHEWGQPVRESVLSKQWALGFSKWRLVPPENANAAAYLCKYLSKSALARVRASARYGQGPITISDHSQLEKVVREPSDLPSSPSLDERQASRVREMVTGQLENHGR